MGLPNWAFPVVLIVSWIFWVASAATPILTFGWGHYGWNGGCNKDGFCADSGCRSFVDTARASYAFAVITVILLSLALIFGIGRLFVKCLGSGSLTKATINLCINAIVTGLVAFATGFAAATASFCGYSYSDNGDGRVGPSAPLGVVGWIFLIGATVMESKGEGGGKGETIASESNTQTTHTETTTTAA